jgi:hypothetical protein
MGDRALLVDYLKLGSFMEWYLKGIVLFALNIIWLCNPMFFYLPKEFGNYKSRNAGKSGTNGSQSGSCLNCVRWDT